MRETKYLLTEEEVANRSPIAKSFIESRSELSELAVSTNNSLLKRFFNVDHNAYLDGALLAKQKELMGLAVSTSLRCDDCISYHIIQSFRLGAKRDEIDETMNISLVIGGSIVIPYLRRAQRLLAELFSD